MLIHFTSGDNYSAAFERLVQIIRGRQLNGGGTKIKGGYRCVCFTEAPLASLTDGFVNPNAYSRYSPFGIIIEKKWLFERGGRPAIYQSDSEFQLLPESLRWRHVRYEPDVIDFTWEREWRIRCDSLLLTPDVAGIVVPSYEWAQKLISDHKREQDFEILLYSQIMDEVLAEQYREEFTWRVYVLK